MTELSKKASEVLLATDPDREGEAIAWHVAEITGMKKPKRVVFHEITKDAILEAIKPLVGLVGLIRILNGAMQSIYWMFLKVKQLQIIIEYSLEFHLNQVGIMFKTLMALLSMMYQLEIERELCCLRTLRVRNWMITELLYLKMIL